MHLIKNKDIPDGLSQFRLLFFTFQRENMSSFFLHHPHLVIQGIFILRPVTNVNRLSEGTVSVLTDSVLPYSHLCSASV